MPEITMGVVRERTDITPEGKFRTYYEVEYFIDDARHLIQMPKEGFTAKAAEAAVQKAAKELVPLQGKKVTLP
jgi:hypothetical protein